MSRHGPRPRNKQAHVDASAGSDRQRALGTPLELGATSSRRPFSHSTLPIPTIPDFDRPICTGRRHIASSSTRIDAETHDGAEMGEELHCGMREVRSPQRHDAVLVTEMDDGVVSILSHGTASAGFRPVFCYERTRRRVLVFEVPSVSLSRDVCTRAKAAIRVLTTLASNQ